MADQKISFDAAVARAKKQLKGLGKKGDNLEIKPLPEQGVVLITNPWNDKSVAFTIYKDERYDSSPFKVLRAVSLPVNLSAIYHISSNTLEVIWTAYKLSQVSEEIQGREFEFRYKDRVHNCSFKDSSQELLELAKSAAYLQISDTGFRNLQSFSQFTNIKTGQSTSRFGTPISFYISAMDIDEADWTDVIRHLNFYLMYFDNKSPYIMIHEGKERKKVQSERYINGPFPSIIVGRELNTILLSLWLSAKNHDLTTAFLLYYRILEYVSGLYLQSKQRSALLKILNSPSIFSSLEKTVDDVAAVIRDDGSSDIDRYTKMFEDIVDKEKIWKEIECNREIFSSDIRFDGGLEIRAMVSNESSANAFGIKGMNALGRALRQIRHGLAHGGEAQAGRLILPTAENFERLRPWVNLASLAASEVVVYEHLG